MDPVKSAVPAQEASFAPGDPPEDAPPRRPAVPYAKCTPCGARVWRGEDPADHAGDACPGCGGALDSVGRLSELVGLRCLRARPRRAYGSHPDRSDRISEQIREAIARNDAERRRRIDAEDS
jgi:ribosomal protein L34E